MVMRRGSRRARGATVVSPSAFGWDAALLATLRHSTLPWDETLVAVPLAEVSDLGGRDRLSLLAQFAAHQALLHFAGISDGDVDRSEWAVVLKRGTDVRLIRTAARAASAESAPPALTLVQQFAELAGAEADVLSQSWARADAVYAEVFARLLAGAAADLRWARASACGELAAPGPDGLRLLTVEQGCFAYTDEICIETVRRFTGVTVLRGGSPLERFSALRGLLPDARASVAAAAERILASTSGLFAVIGWEAFDEGSRQVVETLAHAHHGAWLFPCEGHRCGTSAPESLPAGRRFLVAPRLGARAALDALAPSRRWLEGFVESPDFVSYLAHGDVPPPPALLPLLAEPVRSYIGALAHLGARIPRAIAAEFLAEFHCSAPLETLVVEGLTALDRGEFVFVSEAACAEAAKLVGEESRAAIARLAVRHIEAVLERSEWPTAEETVAALRRVPALSPALSLRYAHALVDCGRYRDARNVSSDELVLARAERRMGDYATALARLERVEPTVLRAEVLRLLQRCDEAARVLDECGSDIEAEYERAILAFEARGTIDESWLEREEYLASRYATYVALARGQFDEAARRAAQSHARARCTAERIDASLDRVFATFSAGRWDEARALGVEALVEVEETQGDRAAAGILFTLAYLAADQAQWAHAAQRIARLRHYYGGLGDALRLEELQLLSAHLDFSRGRFADARRAAAIAFEKCGGQIREAAALILDETDRVEGRKTKLRATGKSGNVELTRRYERLCRADTPVCDSSVADKSVHDELYAFRTALASKDFATARALAGKYDLVLDAAASPAEVEQRVLRTAVVREFPYAESDFEQPWSFATRNRLGQWHAIGPVAVSENGPDTIACSDRELLFFDGCSRWSTEGREAVAAIFRIRAENERLRRILAQEEAIQPAKSGTVEGIVGESPLMRELYALIPRLARRDVPVCILGESGTGKELVARAIHRQSPRRQKPFTAVNCAALPENLIESELFGHVRGAFTGADRDRAGLIETTDGGTLFLDEIGELPLGAQAKLLRFLQEGEFRRVGDTANRTADVRVVSATNRKLEAAVEEGRFRDDLYYRVRGVEVLLAPLRERSGDIALLAAHFLAAEHDRHRSGPSRLAPDVEAIFGAYKWPGNVRELQNTIRAAHAMAGDAKQIELEHLPERLRNVAAPRAAAGSYQDAVARFRRDLIERSLLEVGGNQNRAAAMLRISRQALAYQIRELGILVGSKAQRTAFRR